MDLYTRISGKVFNLLRLHSLTGAPARGYEKRKDLQRFPLISRRDPQVLRRVPPGTREPRINGGMCETMILQGFQRFLSNHKIPSGTSSAAPFDADPVRLRLREMQGFPRFSIGSERATTVPRCRSSANHAAQSKGAWWKSLLFPMVIKVFRKP